MIELASQPSPPMIPVEISSLWNQLPGESSKWFERFNHFRRLGFNRNMRSAYVSYLIATVGQEEVDRRRANSQHAMSGAPLEWAQAAEDYHWIERAEAFDNYQRQLDYEIEEQERAEARKQRRRLLNKTASKLEQAIELADPADTPLHQASQAIPKLTREIRAEYGDEREKLTSLTQIINVLGGGSRHSLAAALRQADQPIETIEGHAVQDLLPSDVTDATEDDE